MVLTIHLYLTPRSKKQWRYTSRPPRAFVACFRVNVIFCLKIIYGTSPIYYTLQNTTINVTFDFVLKEYKIDIIELIYIHDTIIVETLNFC
jgi:hypothetical protein